jgi:preprotein translocase subunit YajC
MGPVIVIAVTFALMWVLFILPQQRRIRAHRAFVETLAVGDRVITTSGLFGTITALDGDEVGLEIAPDVAVRFARGAIAGRPGDETTPEPAPSVPAATAADRALDGPSPTDPSPAES